MEVQQKFDLHQVCYLKKETSVGLIECMKLLETELRGPKADSVGKMQILRPLTGGLLLSALAFQTFSEGLQAEPSLCHPYSLARTLYSQPSGIQGHSLLVLKLVGFEYKN